MCAVCTGSPTLLKLMVHCMTELQQLTAHVPGWSLRNACPARWCKGQQLCQDLYAFLHHPESYVYQAQTDSRAGDMCKGESEGGCYTQVHITCTCMHVCLHRLGCVYMVRSTALGNGHHALSCLSTAAQCNYMSLLVQMRQVGCSHCSSTTCQDPACLALLVRLTNI